LASLRRQVAESLRYPPVARRRGLTGTVYLEITIQTNGAIGTASVVASSSHPLLDEAALETVRHLPRLPFPAELPPRRLRVRLPVIFRLERSGMLLLVCPADGRPGGADADGARA